MKILFYAPPGAEPHAWLASLSQALPQAQFRVWQPGDHGSADYAIVWRPPAELFARRDGLRAVFVLGAGVDALFALEHAAPGTLPRDVPIVRLEDSGMAEQMAEYATYSALRYLRRFDEYERAQRDAVPNWQPLEPHAHATFTIGVLGLGVLGAHVAATLAAMGLPVRGYSRSPKTIEGVATYAGPATPGAAALAPFLDGVKLLVNLLPSTPETAGILDMRTFAQLAPGAYLVNLARGAHLVEADLLAALADGRLAAATLDVFGVEPLPAEHPFWHHPRITVTPHISALTLREPSVGQIAGKIAALERGEPVTGVVDWSRGY
jgi:glyoxylate/hydroxypyruvate reductase A